MIDQKTNSPGNPTWQKGGPSPNPLGRPRGIRERLGSDIVDSVAKLWAEGGDDVMRRLMVEQPDVFARLAVHIGVAKESVAKIEVSQAIPGALEPHQWARLVDILSMIERIAPPGTSPDAVLSALEHALRATLARPVVELEVLPAPIEITTPCPIPHPNIE
jgi:hypothetical protein